MAAIEKMERRGECLSSSYLALAVESIGGSMQSVRKTVAILATVTAVVVSSPVAHAKPGYEEAAVRAALQRISDGTWTEADAEFIGSIPELAGIVEDPRVEPEVELQSVDYMLDAHGQAVYAGSSDLIPQDVMSAFVPSATAEASELGPKVLRREEGKGAFSAPSISAIAAAGTWQKTHVTHTHRSYTGGVIYKYHTYATFKRDGSRVLGWSNRYDDVTNRSIGIDVGVRIVDSKTRTPASSGTSYFKRRIEHCVTKLGCYVTTNPWVKTYVNGNGKTSFSSGVS
ncbi:hypothetical protein [Streptomyces sp. NPDC006879]|uniref:hypothetical protein n=1 Tax=Streptomyces sp. NPDC006879 TaxID=3364767 RepID=UPI003676DA0D